MRLLLGTPFIEPEAGGPAVVIDCLARGIREAGHAVSVASNSNSSCLAEWRYDFLGSKAVVHSFGLWAPLNHQLVRLSRRRRIPVVISTMGMLDSWALAHKAWKKRIAWMAYQRADLLNADCLNATSDLEVDDLHRMAPGRPVALIPRGVEIPGELPQTPGQGPLRILFLSRLHPKKGILDWINGSRDLGGFDWQGLIVGPSHDGHQAVVEAAIRAAGLSDRFSILGPAYGPEAKRELFTSVDLFILPSHSENFGTVIAEAMAYGLPVITTTATPWKSLATERAGWWVPPMASALAEALRQALALDRQTLRVMGLRGRNLVEREFAWSFIIQKHLNLYEWMLGNGPRPDFVKQ